jgi:hypothetical protein
VTDRADPHLHEGVFESLRLDFDREILDGDASSAGEDGDSEEQQWSDWVHAQHTTTRALMKRSE